jgi:hypothetical protein
MVRLEVAVGLLAVEAVAEVVALQVAQHPPTFLQQLVVYMVAVAELLFFKVGLLFAVIGQQPLTIMVLVLVAQCVSSGPAVHVHFHQLVPVIYNETLH